jgi:hypothetical protein
MRSRVLQDRAAVVVAGAGRSTVVLSKKQNAQVSPGSTEAM